jgi:DNA-directed RNA polymerase specialized sigma24 family protein
VADSTGEPVTEEAQKHFHEAVGRLPEAEKEAFRLIWYDLLTHEEAAGQLGIPLSAFRRVWVRARLLLDQAMQGERP